MLYEFPLNEKVRNYLRLESLFTKIDSLVADMENTSADDRVNHDAHFLSLLFNLLDLIERIDLKTELARDLSHYEKVLTAWLNIEGVDKVQIQGELTLTAELAQTMKSSARFGKDLKQEPFLSSIRQRFNTPGITCPFDIPKLHHWLHLPAQKRCADLKKWYTSLNLLADIVELCLKAIRQRAPYQQIIAGNGYYQGVAENRAELIRIDYDSQCACYPTLSGNKFRYVIRFVGFDNDNNELNKFEQDITMQLAIC